MLIVCCQLLALINNARGRECSKITILSHLLSLSLETFTGTSGLFAD